MEIRADSSWRARGVRRRMRLRLLRRSVRIKTSWTSSLELFESCEVDGGAIDARGCSFLSGEASRGRRNGERLGGRLSKRPPTVLTSPEGITREERAVVTRR